MKTSAGLTIMFVWLVGGFVSTVQAQPLPRSLPARTIEVDSPDDRAGFPGSFGIRVPGGKLLGVLAALGREVKLTLNAKDLDLLRPLPPNAIRALVVYGGPLKGVEQLTGLEELTLSGNGFRPADFALVAKLSGLRKLNIIMKELPQSAVALAHMSSLRLESLSLNFWKLDDGAVEQIAGMKSLRHLVLPSLALPQEVLARLGTMPLLESVAVPTCSGCDQSSLERSAVSVAVLSELERFPALKELKVGPMPAAFDLSGFHTLERLTMLQPLPGVDWPQWRLPPNLKYLRIAGDPETGPGHGVPLTDAGLEGLANSVHLESLILSPIRLLGRGLEPLGELEHFTSLVLTAADASPAGLASLRALARLECLSISLQRGNLATLFGAIDGHSNLTDLTVNGGVDTNTPAFRLTSGLPRLRRFYYPMSLNQQWGSEMVSALIEQLTTLEVLELPLMDVWDRQLKHFEKLAGLKQLTIKASSSGLTAAGFQSIGRLPRLEHLQVNSVRPISREGMRQIDQLTGLKSLLLPGGYGTLTSAALSQLNPLRGLEALDLSETAGIDDSAIDALIDLNALRVLNVSGAKITANGLKRLRAALPNCLIIF